MTNDSWASLHTLFAFSVYTTLQQRSARNLLLSAWMAPAALLDKLEGGGNSKRMEVMTHRRSRRERGVVLVSTILNKCWEAA